MEILTEKKEKPTAQLFCAKCEEVQTHALRVDHNEEFVAECQGDGCERFLKFPKGHSFE